VDLRIFVEPQQGASYGDQLAVAQRAEELGFDAFFRSDHYLHMGHVSGHPGPTDAWVTLAAIARETSRIRLGTLVSPTTFRLPGPLAITVAQIDEMSGGRVELGLGAGWFAAEHKAYGIPFQDTIDRFDRFAEQVEIIDGLLSAPMGARFSYDGRHFRVVDSPALPKPVQAPRPPIILGGAARRRSAALAARHADEYNVAFRPPEEAKEVFDRIRTATATTGRTLVRSAAQVVCMGENEAELVRRAQAIGREPADLRQNGIAGSPEEARARLSAFADIGVTRMYLQVLDLHDLDHLDLIAAELRPQA
jgi:F420-dependent oxidoreductase-like protein